MRNVLPALRGVEMERTSEDKIISYNTAFLIQPDRRWIKSQMLKNKKLTNSLRRHAGRLTKQGYKEGDNNSVVNEKFDN